MLPIKKDLVMETVQRHGSCCVRVGGFCMSPAIRNGARVRISSVTPEAVSVGDIIAYFVGNRLCVHRVVEKIAGTLMLRGDRDRPWAHRIGLGEILGKVSDVSNVPMAAEFARRVLRYISKGRR